ncbi:MAG: Obg family GTPase CgtA [Oligoflexales bacterium]
MFVDQTEIHVRSGDGGPGMCSFMTAPYRPDLGPSGGNGGVGGDVYLIASKNMNTLSSLGYRQMYRADHGAKGLSQNKTGRGGRAKKIRVPIGTVVFDRETGECLGDLSSLNAEILVAQGGKRGYGNIHFTTPTDRAPRKSTPGEKGVARTLRLELKLLADVGLAGFPNAGKSSLLRRCSAAEPKVADYPFTTRHPQLGVVDAGDYQSFVMADIPGLLEGASTGRGLGHEFLRHLERTRAIAYVIDCLDWEREPEQAYDILSSEMSAYQIDFKKKKSLVVLNKVDLMPDQEDRDKILNLFKKKGLEVLCVSTASGEGLLPLKRRLFELTRASDVEHDGSPAMYA